MILCDFCNVNSVVEERGVCDECLRKEGMCLLCAGSGEEPGSVRDPDYGMNKCKDCQGTGESDAAVNP